MVQRYLGNKTTVPVTHLNYCIYQNKERNGGLTYLLISTVATTTAINIIIITVTTPPTIGAGSMLNLESTGTRKIYPLVFMIINQISRRSITDLLRKCLRFIDQ